MGDKQADWHRCVECGEQVKSLYVEYSRGNTALRQCPGCGQIADKYIEFEWIVVFIDMLLHRHQAVRHLLNHRFSDQTFVRAWIVMVFIEIYTKWAFQETNMAIAIPLASFHVHLVYLGILTVLENLVFHSTVNASAFFLEHSSRRVGPAHVSMVLLTSSFGKFLALFPMVWNCDQVYFRGLISVFVFTSNMEAIVGCLNTSHPRAFVHVLLGNLAKSLFRILILVLIDPQYPVWLW